MFRHLSLALLAGVTCLGAEINQAAAFDGAPLQEPSVIYAREPEASAPMRSAYADRSNLGGGFIEFLFLVEGNGRALRYGIGVGRPGFTWAGVKTISAKREWPDWTPPAEMLARRPDLPRHMEGGPENPLGARAMYLGSTLYRIHGSNEPWTIGTNVSSGCIRMRNEDVIDLYGRVNVGARVIVL